MPASAAPVVARRAAGLDRDELQVGLAVLVAASAAIHLAVTPAHLGESLAFGIFFAVCGILQFLVAAACVFRASRAWVLVAAVLSAAVAVVWLASRTVGVPVGPSPWRPERVGLGDVVATLYEVAAVAVALALARRLPPRARSRARMTVRLSTWSVFVGWVTVGAMITGH